MTDKKHWYVFAYAFNGGFGRITFGFKAQEITESILTRVEETIKIKNRNNPVVLGWSYMGYMKQDEVSS